MSLCLTKTKRFVNKVFIFVMKLQHPNILKSVVVIRATGSGRIILRDRKDIIETRAINSNKY